MIVTIPNNRILILLSALTLLQACGTPPPPPPEIPQVVEEIIVEEPEAPIVLTADDLLQQAADAAPEQAGELLLQAAQLLYTQGNITEAANVAAFINPEVLDTTEKTDMLLLQADVALATQQPSDVITLLRASNFPNLQQLDNQRRIRYHELRARAQFDTARIQQSIIERIELDAILPPDAISANHEAIWKALHALTLPQLQGQSTANNADAQGWYELALISRRNSDDLDKQLAELKSWLTARAGHPAALILPKEMAITEVMAQERPQQIALLLPLDTAAGTIVRDAFMSAYFDLQEIGGQVPVVKIYNTAGISDVRALHRQARMEGAQLVIGPLLKQDVALLQQEPDLGVPTLALNNVEGQSSASPLFFQFSLAPETEARQLANKAWRDGHRRVAILSPPDSAANDVYTRKRESFLTEWKQLGGTVASIETYADNYTTTISNMLLLAESEQRMQRLRDLIRQPVQFVQHRRQDVDFIYLLAQPAPARQIVPSLAYLFAGDIPVYASQDVYSGQPRPIEDKDINGVIFGDSPWLLNTENPATKRTRDLFPMNSAQNSRLQAFGIDAFRLYPRLRLFQEDANSNLPGATGTLKLGPNNTIERELSWAVIRDGRAIVEN
ncbi:MAG: penicillin-binding protein activator [Pseudomonadota bacterium]